MRHREKENTIHEIYGKTTFLKIKPAFRIGKLEFAFVEYQNTGGNILQTKSINCYLDISEAALLGKKLTDGRLYKKIESERLRAKEAGQVYPRDVWASPLGGVNEEKTKERNLRKDGYAISRSFRLGPGAQQYAVITAYCQKGKTDKDSGIIIPVTNDSEKTVIRVPFANWNECEKLGIMLSAAAVSYINYAASQPMPADTSRNQASSTQEISDYESFIS